jgi:SAM-dependent methyltransferase
MNETKFNGMGKVYAKFRPAYPQAFIEYICSDVGITQNSTIADIGSGTGILTKQLLGLGSNVFAVEPNDDMRVMAENDLSSFSNFVSVNATAENTTLDNNSVDFITVAQAFHWFDREKFKAECQRILKPNGKVILVWNSRIFGTEVVEDGDKINKKYCPHFQGFSGGMRGVLYNSTGVESESDFNDFFNGVYETRIFENHQTFDLDGFIGRNLSASYALKEDDENYPAYITELTECFNKHAVDGKLIMPNNTRSYVGAIT